MRHDAGLLLQYGEDALMIDCQPRILSVLYHAGYGNRLAQIDKVVITHNHADHVGGMEQLLLCKKYGPNSGAGAARMKPSVVALHDVLCQLWDNTLRGGLHRSLESAALLGPDDYYTGFGLEECERMRLGAFDVELHRTKHAGIPSAGVKVRAGTHTLGYSGDALLDKCLIGWLWNADLVIHDIGGGNVHASYEEMAQMPYDLRRRMLGIHYPDGFTAPDKRLRLAQEGMRYTLSDEHDRKNLYER